MKRKRLMVAVGICMLIAAILAICFFTRDTSPKGSSTTKGVLSSVSSTSSAAPSMYPPPDAKEFADILNGSDKKMQQSLLPKEFQDADWSASDVVPHGKTLVIDQASFGSAGAIGWLIGQYKTPNGVVDSETIIHLEYQGGQWRIKTFEGK